MQYCGCNAAIIYKLIRVNEMDKIYFGKVDILVFKR